MAPSAVKKRVPRGQKSAEYGAALTLTSLLRRSHLHCPRHMQQQGAVLTGPDDEAVKLLEYFYSS